VAFQCIQDKYNAPIAHDGGALKLLALLQTTRQWFDQYLNFR
jgi:hypothetical protein